MTESNHNELQLSGARNTFFGILHGFDGSVNINLPNYVYHYTSLDSFESIINSQTIRLYTIANFDDEFERKLAFSIEKRVQGAVTNNTNGEKFDFTTIVNAALSDDHIFIQSNSSSQDHRYLWKNYAKNGGGVCLRLSTKKYIQYLNNNVEDFDLIPDYFKCCYVSYDNEWANQFMEILFPAIESTKISGGAENIVWFFFLEYWRNFIKSKHPYSAEEEIRFVVSDNYSLFLLICSLLAKWGLFTTHDKSGLEKTFFSEYQRRKNKIHSLLHFNQVNGTKFITIPLYDVFDSVIIGPKASMSKDEISILSNRKIKKSQITKSSIVLDL